MTYIYLGHKDLKKTFQGHMIGRKKVCMNTQTFKIS